MLVPPNALVMDERDRPRFEATCADRKVSRLTGWNFDRFRERTIEIALVDD